MDFSTIQKEKSISLKFDLRLPISPKQEQRSEGQEYKKWPKKKPKSQAQQLAKEHIQDFDQDPP